MFGSRRRLADAGVLGINRRNAEYTLAWNDRRYYPLVDDKLLTKKLAQQAGIAVPDLYGVVEIQRQVRELPALLSKHEDFVIKPAHGSGGDGILVVAGRSKGHYRKVNGALLTDEELMHYVSNVLSGMYSLGGAPDKAMIESRVEFDPVFEKIAYQGVPDIRIIVYRGVPAMSMVRLPTQMSDGKANLHQGAIGAGIDMATGETTTAVRGNSVVTEHPDTGSPVTGTRIPNWPRLLELAARCYEMTGLGYQGVDIVLDRNRGPMILEVNARPGLNIQIANRTGLLLRLRKIDQDLPGLVTVADRVDYARRNFA